MSNIHLVLMAKGGVGKTYVASLLSQFFRKLEDVNLVCMDADPANYTFEGYKSLKVEVLKLTKAAGIIDVRMFDDLVDRLMTSTDETFVIDTGASTFLPMMSYLVENDIFNDLKAAGHTVTIHTILTAGQALADTINGYQSIIKYASQIRIVVWLNEYLGPVVKDGVSFENGPLYKKNENKLHAVIKIPQKTEETFGRDVKEMLQDRLTYDEAIQDAKRSMMCRKRLRITWSDLTTLIEHAQLG